MTITIEVHDTPKTTCDTKGSFEQGFNAQAYKADFEVLHVNTSGEDKIVVITPNGDRRVLAPLRLDVLDVLLKNLTR